MAWSSDWPHATHRSSVCSSIGVDVGSDKYGGGSLCFCCKWVAVAKSSAAGGVQEDMVLRQTDAIQRGKAERQIS